MENLAGGIEAVGEHRGSPSWSYTVEPAGRGVGGVDDPVPRPSGKWCNLLLLPEVLICNINHEPILPED